eukprot:gene9322-6559_t
MGPGGGAVQSGGAFPPWVLSLFGWVGHFNVSGANRFPFAICLPFFLVFSAVFYIIIFLIQSALTTVNKSRCIVARQAESEK